MQTVESEEFTSLIDYILKRSFLLNLSYSYQFRYIINFYLAYQINQLTISIIIFNNNLIITTETIVKKKDRKFLHKILLKCNITIAH